jgi:hypothetical protein
MNLYRLHVKNGVDEPEDWTRVLIPFAGTGLRIYDSFKRDVIIEAGPLLIKEIMGHLYQCVELFDYDPSQRDMIKRQSGHDEDTPPWL